MFMTNRTCICCGSEIRQVKNSPPSPPESAAWNNGIVHILYAGFGSRFDTSGFIVAVCDPCVERKLAEGVIERKKRPFPNDSRYRHIERIK